MSRHRGALTLSVVVVLIGSLLLARRGGAHPPSFSRGGTFAEAVVATPSPVARSDAATPLPSAAPRTTTIGRLLRTPRNVMAPAAALRRPLLGTYTYGVNGWEGVTGFGKRDFPAKMTLHAQHSTDAKPDEVAFDLAYSSKHEEREFVSFTNDGVALTYEAGSVTFGPYTQTSEASYTPHMTQVALPLAVGTERHGTSKALAPDGSVVRTEDWTVKVLRQEKIASTGTYVVQVHRQTRPGSSEQVTRDRTYWYDPARAIWIKWHETMHAERNYGVHFTYDDDYTATLASYSP